MDSVPPLTSALLRVLVSSPDLNGLVRLVFAFLTAPLCVRGVALLDASRTPPRFLAHYCPGVSHLQGHYPHDAFQSTPRIVLEAMEGRPGIEIHDHESDPHAMAAWPIDSVDRPMAVLVVIVGPDVDHVHLRDCLDQVASVTAVYLAGLTHDPYHRHEYATSATGPRPPMSLSARQRAVLQGMARGLTLRQISGQIAFSESTVRAESLAIYRHLGVHDRREAVAVALERGLLGDPEDEGAPRQLTID